MTTHYDSILQNLLKQNSDVIQTPDEFYSQGFARSRTLFIQKQSKVPLWVYGSGKHTVMSFINSEMQNKSKNMAKTKTPFSNYKFS